MEAISNKGRPFWKEKDFKWLFSLSCVFLQKKGNSTLADIEQRNQHNMNGRINSDVP
jgi:hypothetical protein